MNLDVGTLDHTGDKATARDPVPAPSAAAGPPAAPWLPEACEQCGAPVDISQRYCVVCGSRRRHAHDPAASFLSAAAGRSRSDARTRQRGPAGGRRAPGLGTALAIALIPLAVGLGVLVGRASDSADGRLLAALRAQKPEVVNVGGTGSATAAGTPAASTNSVPVANLTSSFPLPSGYAVQLGTLPAGSTQSAATAAVHADEGKGARGVGLVSQSDYAITPPPPRGAFVIYSGAYKTAAVADAALARLRRAFPGAKVIALKSTASSPSGGGKVLARTRYGTANPATGYQPSAADLSRGSQIVNKIARTMGQGYVGSQQGLPSAISVP